MHYRYSFPLFFLFSLIPFQKVSSQTVNKNDTTFGGHKNVIAIDPLYFAFGYFNISYERALSKEFGLFARLDYRHWDNNFPDSNINYYIGTVQTRFYPLGNAPEGLFVGGFIYYHRSTFITPLDTSFYDEGGKPNYFPHGNLNAIAFGGIVGYRFIIKNRITAEIYTGLGPNFWWGNNYQYSGLPYDTRLAPQFGVNLGYAFW
jgi:hypothetical protein